MAALLLSVAFQVKLNLSKWKLTTVINKLVNLRNTWTLANKQAVTMIGAATFSLISKKNCILKKQWHEGVLPKNQMWKYLHKSQEKICGSAGHLIKFFTTKFTNLICQIYFEYITSYLDFSLSFILNRRYDIYYFISTWPQAYLIKIYIRKCIKNSEPVVNRVRLCMFLSQNIVFFKKTFRLIKKNI